MNHNEPSFNQHPITPPNEPLLHYDSDNIGIPETLSPELTVRERAEQMLQNVKDMSTAYAALQNALPDEQVEFVDSLAGNIFDVDPFAQTNRLEVINARKANNKPLQQELAKAQTERFAAIRKEVAMICGVELNDPAEENEKYRKVIIERVKESGVSWDQSEEIIRTLGFLVKNEQGDEVFSFPKDIVPPHLQELWDRYVDFVKQHMNATSVFDRGLNDNQGEIVLTDSLRRMAHNHLAEALTHFLNIKDWDIVKSRGFVSKMLEQRIPTVKTDESALTSKAIAAGLNFTDRRIGESLLYLGQEERRRKLDSAN